MSKKKQYSMRGNEFLGIILYAIGMIMMVKHLTSENFAAMCFVSFGVAFLTLHHIPLYKGWVKK